MKTTTILSLLAIILCLYSCDEDFNEIHDMAGVWEIESIEHYEVDTITKDLVLKETYTDAGYFYFYDNNKTSDLNNMNSMYFHIEDSAKCNATEHLIASSGGSTGFYWYADDTDRLNLYVFNSAEWTDYFSVYTIASKGKRKQEWHFFQIVNGYVIKEVLHVKRARN